MPPYQASATNQQPFTRSTTRSKNVVVLGSTGSIGVSTLDVIQSLSERLTPAGMSAHSNIEKLLQQAEEFRPQWITITDAAAADAVDRSRLPKGVELLKGAAGIERMVSAEDVDVVMAAIVGAAGLEGTWAALEAGKTVAVANKETLVMAGSLVMDLARRRNAKVLPVDSEHSAVFQALQCGKPAEVERIVLTASGGPFRGRRRRELEDVAARDALQHPTWRMGDKITIDSATLMNKALEVIEARWLFGVDADRIEVVIHPESIVHSFVEFNDGSVIAQLSPPDMRLPIQYALTYPERLPGPAKRLPWHEMSAWHFEQPDLEAFPALELGFEVARAGGTSGAALNAANEVAVGRFLRGDIGFLDITQICRDILDNHEFSAKPTLAELYATDSWARQEADNWKNRKTLSTIRN